MQPGPAKPLKRADFSGGGVARTSTIGLGVIGTPLIFGLSVHIANPVFAGQPLSIPFKITNENIVPFEDIDYSCDVDELDIMNGPRMEKLEATPANAHRDTLAGRDTMTARCENAYQLDPGAKFKSAQISLRLTYRPWVWPTHGHLSKSYVAIIDDYGHLAQFVPK
jgi:hypothetical protein